MKKEVGIYLIRNKINGKVYVGQSSNIKNRWVKHRSELKLNKHGNKHLQLSWNKYGEQKFEFSISQFCSTEQLTFQEQITKDYFELFKGVYNQAGPVDHPTRGVKNLFKHSSEAKQKIGEAGRGRILSIETKQKMSESKKGIKIPIEHTKRLKELNIGNKYRAGKKHTQNTINKLKISRLNNNYRFKSCQKFVERIDINTGEVKEYENIKNTVLDGFSIFQIRRCCNGKRKSHKGFYWKYL